MSILNPINDLVAWVLTHIYNVLATPFGATSGVTWVLSIAILVVIMRLILLPLFIKQMHTQRAMTALTPKISELRKKYKGDRETLNAETMKLYQEAGVNPLMGCLPIVLQMPLFFALFAVLRAISEPKPHKAPPYHLTTAFIKNANNTRIFGVSIRDTFLHASTLHVHVVIALVVVTSMVTTYLTVRQSMKRGMMPTGSDNPMGQSQKLMAYVLPLFALTGLYWPFGLVLYWVFTNLWTLGQQYVLLRKYPVGAAAMGPDGNVPIGGAGRKPAVASGFTSPSRRQKPSDKPGQGGKPGQASRPGQPARPGQGSRPGQSTRPGQPGKASQPARPAVADKRGPTDSPPADRAAVADRPPADSRGTADKAGEAYGHPQLDAKPGKSDQSGQTDAGVNGRRDGKATRTPSGKPRPAGAGAAGSAPRAGEGTRSASDADGSTNGQKPGAEGSGILRRFGRGRAEAEAPVEVEPEARIVRQQRQRQSRSKRSGKR